jgi:hypothetical protein
MLDRAHDGPIGAMVTSVRILEEGLDPPDGFDVWPTV